MHTIQLTAADVLPDEEVKALEGTLLWRAHYNHVVQESTTVLKPDGSPLLIYKADALSAELCDRTRRAFYQVRIPMTDNRGASAGGEAINGRASRAMASGVMGFMDRMGGRNPLCRMTSFTREHVDVYDRFRPMAEEVNRAFRRLAPDRYEAQRKFVAGMVSDWVIPDTVFTAVTINHNERFAAHCDKGDYEPGFGVMSVLEKGVYHGGLLIFPKYKVAVDLRQGGVLLADVHQFHGNGPLIGEGPYKRLSFVFYARRKMDQCGTIAEEIARASGSRPTQGSIT